MIKYIGSKRRLVPEIVRIAQTLGGSTALDLFSGTARVGHALKRAGFRVTANDHNAYAHALGVCYVQADAGQWREPARELIERLNRVDGKPGYFTRNFCEASRYLQPENGARVDAIRDRIAELKLDPELEAIASVSLMEAADRVDSTVGVQMAYLKQWAPRASKPLSLRLPNLAEGRGQALMLDAAKAAKTGTFDVAYLDPPYNQHKYRNNYHVWETLVRWDQPEVYGVACKRMDCREYRSEFNSKRTVQAAMQSVLDAVDARYVIVSFSDEGNLSRDTLCNMLAEQGDVHVMTFEQNRYVGARIGIYNPSGEKVGRVCKTRNREMLFILDRSRAGALSRISGERER